MTGEFPAQRASNAENVSIWRRHHVWLGAEQEPSHYLTQFTDTYMCDQVSMC